jgi:UDP-galactopyranose mutase
MKNLSDTSGFQRAKGTALGRPRQAVAAEEAILSELLPAPVPSGSSVQAPATRRADLLCCSHLRWDFVFQRPQHLLTRFAAERRVFYVEEPIFGEGPDRLEVLRRERGLRVVRPHLPHGLSETEQHGRLRVLIDRLCAEQRIVQPLLWYYTPMALPFSSHLEPRLVVYDCMDELSAFAGAPPMMRERERLLMTWADLVFTGGASLYAHKRNAHPRVHLFPSSVDRAHFARAQVAGEEPADQASLAHPRIGFFGVVDERFDVPLLEACARLRPDWQFIIIGPVVKIDPAALPRLPNIHYLGKKDYTELPRYLAGWDVAMLPFARNDSTRFISPTKTPEYLSAKRPVVSTSITDVVRPYGDLGLVQIADKPDDFVAAIERARLQFGDPAWRTAVDDFLGTLSWDRTWDGMDRLMASALEEKGLEDRQGPGVE